MWNKKTSNGKTIFIAMIITAAVVGTATFMWQQNKIDHLTKNINSQNENVDQSSALSDDDFTLYNKVVTQTLPHICDYQKNVLHNDTESAACILYDIDQLGGNATGVLQQYRNSLRK